MFLIFNDVVKPEEKTSIVEVLRVGKWVYGGREIEFTEEDLKHIVENFKKGIRPNPPTELVVDYNHGSMEIEPDKSKAAGWVKDLFYEKGSLYAKIKWTPRAREYIMNDEFRYVSAEIDPNYIDKKTGQNRGITLMAVALTNRPFIEGQDSISLSERDDLHKKAEARSKKYHIHVRPDGHLTKPSEYSDCPDDEFADPVNYRYPLNTPERVMAAYKYFSKPSNRAFYSPEEQKIIERRIKAKLPKDIQKNAFRGGDMANEDVIKLSEELAKYKDEVLKLTEENKAIKAEVEKLKNEIAEKDKALLMSEAHEWVEKELANNRILAKEKELFTEMYIKDKEYAKKFVEARGQVLPKGAIGSSEGEQAFDEITKIEKYADEHNLTFAEARVEMAKKGLI